MYSQSATIHDRLEEIMESVSLIEQWSGERKTVDDYMTSPTGVMAFNAIVMRLQCDEEIIVSVVNDDLKALKAAIESLLAKF